MYGETKVRESKDLEPIHGPHPRSDKPNMSVIPIPDKKEQKVKKRETRERERERERENEAKEGEGRLSHVELTFPYAYVISIYSICQVHKGLLFWLCL